MNEDVQEKKPEHGAAYTILRDFVHAVDGGKLKPYASSRTRPSWTLCADTVIDVLTAIITGRVRFDPDDWSKIQKLVGGRWGSDRVVIAADGGEGWYRLACQAGNTSAAIAFERTKGRKPFRAMVLNYAYKYGTGGGLDRLHVGASFSAGDGQVWAVTSFPTAEEIIVCRYQEGRSAPVARKRLTQATFAELIKPPAEAAAPSDPTTT